MKYIGLFTGRIFNTKAEANSAAECCANVDDEDERLNDGTAYNDWHSEQLAKCKSCLGCPRAN